MSKATGCYPHVTATGQTLRCDVFVDTIHRMEITTRTRELLLEEEPERFEILGFDNEGKDKIHSPHLQIFLIVLCNNILLSNRKHFQYTQRTQI